MEKGLYMSHLQVLRRMRQLEGLGYGSHQLEKMYESVMSRRKRMADNIRLNRYWSVRPDNKARKTCLTRPIIVTYGRSRTVKMGKSGIVPRSQRWAAPLSEAGYHLVPLEDRSPTRPHSVPNPHRAVKLGKIEKVWHMFRGVRPIMYGPDCRYQAVYRKQEFTSDSPKIVKDRYAADRLSVDQLIRYNAEQVRK
jgi:hypothetical protein